MVWFLGLSALALSVAYLFSLWISGNIPSLVRSLRYVVGGAGALVALLLLVRGQAGIGSLVGAAAASVLMRGRLGPIDFTSSGTAPGQTSKVRSRLFEMQLDHDSGNVSGRVISGRLAGTDLYQVMEDDMRALIVDAQSDPDSFALLETWLNTNRPGWQEHLGLDGSDAGSSEGGPSSSGPMTEQDALDVLGLKPGASVEDIKAAHRRLLKVVHPDHGGSATLAARINAAKDLLLKKP